MHFVSTLRGNQIACEHCFGYEKSCAPEIFGLIRTFSKYEKSTGCGEQLAGASGGAGPFARRVKPKEVARGALSSYREEPI